MKKRIVTFILAVLMTLPLSLGSNAHADSAPKMRALTDTVFVCNGVRRSPPPYMVGQALYLPLRASAEAYGNKVGWTGSAATVETWKQTFTLPIGEENILIGSVTYAPASFFTESLGLTLSAGSGRIELSNLFTPVSFRFDFEAEKESFIPVFADYHDDGSNFESYTMKSSYGEIPGLGSKGLYIASTNRSDDIFMGYFKCISGLERSREYNVSLSFSLATNVAPGQMGVGGAPGESVFVKAGTCESSPNVERDSLGAFRFTNVDIGKQSQGGLNLSVVGDMAKPEDAPEGFVFKEFSVKCRAVTNSLGELYIMIGTDSGFEGFTEYYLDNISVECALV